MALAGSAFLSPVSVPVDVAAPSTRVSSAAPAVSQGAEWAAAPTMLATSGAAGAAVLAVAALSQSTQRQSRRGARAARRFFGGATTPAPAPVPKGPLAVPMLPEPEYRQLNDSLVAEMDAGFDPLNLATKTSPWGTGADSYYNYREAEVKHGRLAMLATVGWLSSEELQGALARKLGLADSLATGELAPSLINGGLGNLPAWFLPGVFALSAWIELVPRKQGNRADVLKYKVGEGRIPGDLGFDPLAFKGTLTAMDFSLSRLHNAEVKHGRAAMIAIVAFVAQEFVSKVPIIAEDEISADRVVELVDKGIATVDDIASLSVPELPVPFPVAGI